MSADQIGHAAGRPGLQYARFGVVGLAATGVHVVLFATLIEARLAAPLLANAFAFCLALLISFAGHFWLTFPAERRRSRRRGLDALFRFAIVALLGLALNSLTVYLIVDLLEMSYRYAMVPMISVVPLAVFVLSKFWAFG